MDTNDRIADLLNGIPEEASVLLTVKADGSYVMIWENGGAWKMIMLTNEQGEALALIYPADMRALSCVTASVMLANLRIRIVDEVLSEIS